MARWGAKVVEESPNILRIAPNQSILNADLNFIVLCTFRRNGCLKTEWRNRHGDWKFAGAIHHANKSVHCHAERQRRKNNKSLELLFDI